MKKRVLALFICLMLLAVSIAYAVDVPKATSNFFVNDFAEIFSDEDIKAMMEKAIDLDQNHDGIQVVVTTVKTIGNDSLEVYANKMYNQYGIGNDDMGVLLLVVTEDRLIRAEVGDMLQTYIPDSKIGKIMDDVAIPYLKENKFAEGMVSFQAAIIDEIKQNVVPQVERTENFVTTVPLNQSSDGTTGLLDESDFTADVEKNNTDDGGHPMLVIFMLLLGFASGLIVAKARIAMLTTKINNESDEHNRTTKKYNELWHKLDASEKDLEVQKSWVQFYKNEQERINKSFESISVKHMELRKEATAMREELAKSREMIKNVYELHPNIEGEIAILTAEKKKQADMHVADKFDNFAAKVSTFSGDMKNLETFKKTLAQYHALSAEQKSYVKTDMALINAKHEEACKCKEEYEAKIQLEAKMREAKLLKTTMERELSGNIIPTMEQYDKLRGYMRNYRAMCVAAKAIFPENLVNNFNVRILDTCNAAEAEHKRLEAKRREEEERRQKEEARRMEEEQRRRQARRTSTNTYSSSYSSSRSSFGSFGGHGGHSSGGGASGKF